LDQGSGQQWLRRTIVWLKITSLMRRRNRLRSRI
jgi:hypothetical protein